jgi:hypothetical protein
MDEHYYLYALTRIGCEINLLSRGVDPRFPVEIVACAQTAALASRVGLDQFDLKKLERENTDVNWLSQVAIRHNQIISDAACFQPVLPLRLGTLFNSRQSLLSKMEQWESVVIDFLDSIGNSQEWAAKIYLAPPNIEDNPVAVRKLFATRSASVGTGTRYLMQKGNQRRKSHAWQQYNREEVAKIEATLMNQADRYCRSRPLHANLTGRREKMLWNAAFLLSRAISKRWLALAEVMRSAAACKGLLLEISGPWPPYHFCPTLESSQQVFQANID